MLKSDKHNYDVVIIGAGISGLVCGCYLAKAGMNVLIAEQHHKPGGYCTSFKRQGFTFDAAAHSFGGFRKDGIVRKVITDLEIDKKITIKRFDPSDIIITPDYKVSFWNDVDKTYHDLQKAFPDESNNIENFFHYLIDPDPMSLARMRNWTFQDLLDKYFKNDKLKAILSFPLFGNGGLPPSRMSAFIGVTIFTEFLLDGGYYPEGGMQALPDALADRFKELGGELLLSCSVTKITIKNTLVNGVILEGREFIPSDYVVSNCDARQTFLKLVGKNNIGHDFLLKINTMIPSLSIFVTYLGIDHSKIQLPEPGVNIWFLSTYDMENVYLSAKKGNYKNINKYMIHVMPDRKSILCFENAPFKNKKYWDDNKEKWLETSIRKIEMDAIPGLSEDILYRGAATPYTLFKYTLNYKGASYGWACMPSQFTDSDFRKPSFIKGLYLTGHWSTQGLGIPAVTYLGYDTANTLIKKEQIKNMI